MRVVSSRLGIPLWAEEWRSYRILAGSEPEPPESSTSKETSHAREDVRALVDEALKVLEPQAEGRSLQLKVEQEESPSPVHCDRERVLEVITNLVGNAIKFTKDGGEKQGRDWRALTYGGFLFFINGAGLQERCRSPEPPPAAQPES